MKSEEGIVEQVTTSRREENIQPMASLILETVAGFGRGYGQHYIAQFLTADRYLLVRTPQHREIGTLGKLRNRNLEDVVCTIHYLIDAGLLQVKEPQYNTVEISEEGQRWLAQPQEIHVMKQRVRFSALEKYLRSALREHRSTVASKFEMKAWEVLSDYTMDRIVLTKPLDLDTLSRIPGFATIKCERFGEGFVKTVQDVIEHFEEFRRASLLQKVKRGSYPRVKTLFMQNVTLPEIAQVCDILIGTVCGYLRDLHEANLVDLIPWIERNINSKSLYAGVEYFERVRQPNLKEAYNTLGLDYNTLLFCRLYAKDKRMQRAETRLMAS